MSLIKCENLSKAFSRGGRDFFAAQDIDFEVRPGDFINIVGKSGSGKSTLLSLISAIIDPTSGRLMVDEQNIFDLDDQAKSKYRNEFIGYVPQSLGTLSTLNVRDNVRLPHFLAKRSGDGIKRAEELLDKCGILDLKDDFCKNLSGGELKRVLLARALMNEPRVLIADEPTSDLDSKTTVEIMDMIKSFNDQGTTVIIVTHDNDLLRYGSRLLEMNDGFLKEMVL